MTDTKEPNPNATIQLDAANAADIVLESSPKLPEPERSDGGTVRRVTPPPLPPSVSQPPTPTPVAPPAKNRTVIYGVAFVVLLALVIGLGVKVGGSLRPAAPTPTPVASASAAPTPAASATAPATQTNQTIVIKTIEMNDQTDGG
jgi:hypothetical protein